ncbi:hypothetical protein D3C80_1717900 [compost metagenome]
MAQMQKAMIDMQQQFELLKQQRELDYKVWSDQLDAEVKEAQMTADNVVKIKQINTPKVNADVEMDTKRD